MALSLLSFSFGGGLGELREREGPRALKGLDAESQRALGGHVLHRARQQPGLLRPRRRLEALRLRCRQERLPEEEDLCSVQAERLVSMKEPL